MLENILTVLENYDGTIGTLIGIVFSYWLQSKGKLKLLIKKSFGEFYYNNRGFITPSRNKDSSLEYYKYNLDLYLYNTSSEFKSIRNLKLNVYSDGKKFITGNLKDENSNNVSCKNVDICNVAPKNVEVLNLLFYISKDELKNINYNKCYFELEYIDFKDKVKKLKVFNEKLKELIIEE